MSRHLPSGDGIDFVAVRPTLLRRVPDWIEDAVTAAGAAAQHHQLPIALVRQHATPLTRALVVMTITDFCRWVLDITCEEYDS